MRAGRLRAGARALAARRRPAHARGVADDGGAQSCRRPLPAGRDRGREVAGGGGAVACRGARRTRRWRSRQRRGGRPAAAHLHVLPPGTVGRSPGRAHVADARGPDDGRDRARVPRAGTDDGAAAGPGEAEDPSRGHPLPRAAGARAAGTNGGGAGSAVPALQRGVRGDGGCGPRPPEPVRGSDPSRPHARRPDARRARGPRPARADAAPRRPARVSRRRGRRPDPLGGPGPHAVGSRRDRRGGRRARRRAPPRPAGPVPGAGRDRRVPRDRTRTPRRPTGPRSRCSTASCRASSARRSSN